ncbi:aminoglycoside phosphotransferase family protein [Candidatus Sumerlaeota bacterium]|nr:aminoglycoside phosphotransferase family protein [Candidatus Sumerlaeota bacterium]
MGVSVAKVEEAFRSYVLRYLLPMVGLSEKDTRITIPISGVKTVVRLVEPREQGADFSGIVVKIYSRKEAGRVERIMRIGRFLKKHNVYVPRILDVCKVFKRDGVIFVAEELISGESGLEVKMTPDRAKTLARSIKALHLVPTDDAEFGQLFVNNFVQEMKKRVANRIKGLNRFARIKGKKSNILKITKWLSDQMRIIRDNTSLHLIHDKLHPGNIIYSGKEDRFYLIDIETVQPGCPTKDLMQIYHETLKEDPELIEAFESVYFEEPSPLSREQMAALTPFCDAYYHLAESAINWKRHFYHLKRQRQKGDDRIKSESSFSRNARLHLDELLKLIERE